MERFYKHKIKNINEAHDETLTLGDKIADKVAAGMGSIPFVVIQSIILAIWIIWNEVPFLPHFDPAPFILLNLCLSFQAAYAAPFIMVSQNRQAAKDRLMAEHDYEINMKAFNHLSDQDKQLLLSNEKQDRLLEMIQLGNNELAEQTQMLIRLLEEKQA